MKQFGTARGLEGEGPIDEPTLQAAKAFCHGGLGGVLLTLSPWYLQDMWQARPYHVTSKT